MSLSSLSRHPHFQVRFHPALTVRAGDGGKYIVANPVGEFEIHYRTDIDWHCALVEMLCIGAPMAMIRHRLFPLLDFDDVVHALIGLDLFFRSGLLVLNLVPDPAAGKTFLTLALHHEAWMPRFADLDDDEKLTLSRFATLRREDGEVVLEAPLKHYHLFSANPESDRLFMQLMRGERVPEILDAWPSAWHAMLREVIAMLKHDGFLVAVPDGADFPTRYDEAGPAAAQWDVHDLYLHSSSRTGYTPAPLLSDFGGMFPNIGRYDPLPAVRPAWQGPVIALDKPDLKALYKKSWPFAGVQDFRHSVRQYDDENPVTLLQLGHFLYRSCRVMRQAQMEVSSPLANIPGKTMMQVAWRPYPTGGSSYELEIYLSVDKCGGLEPGFYHYDAGEHQLVKIAARTPLVKQMLMTAHLATAYQAKPQIVFHIAARFQRVSWKYRAIAYSVILKDTGVLYQTMYLVATAMKLGPCGLGSGDIALFEKITGLDPLVEGTVGDFGLGSLPPGQYEKIAKMLKEREENPDGDSGGTT